MRLAALALVVLLAGFVPAGEHGLVVARGKPVRRARAIEPMAPAHLPGWRALRDRDTGVAAWLWGGRIAVPGAIADPAVAERAARAFLAAHLDLLAPGASPADFTLAGDVRTGGLRTVGFTQTAGGLPVVGGAIGFVFGNDRLFAVASRALPNVRVVQPAASASAAVLASRAEAWLGVPATTRAVRGRVILPLVRGPGDIAYQVAWRLDVAARGAPGRWDVYVAPDGQPIARESRIAYATGTVQLDAPLRYPGGGRAPQAAPALDVTVDGSAATTDSSGGFSWTAAGDATVVPSLTGTYVTVENVAGPAATTTLDVPAGGAATWSLASDAEGDAQLSTYIFGGLAKAHARLVNPALDAWLDQPAPFFVNDDGTCNAYSTGDEVHLFQGDATCENSGRLADIVFHEFGHSMHYHSILPGMGAFDVPLSEGLADFNAADLNDDPGIGRGFYFDDTPVRDIDPPDAQKAWPGDDSSDPHVAGEIVSGALWDLREALVAQLGSGAGLATTRQIFTGIMQRSPDIPSSYMAALIADDDDGDLGDGTPHDCAIRRAFGPHGLVPGFEPTTVGLPALAGTTITLPVDTPSDPACPPPRVTSVTLTWRLPDGRAGTVPLAFAAGAWTGALPTAPDGTIVAYQLDAAFDDGSHVLRPDNPADPWYQVLAGAATPIWCETFDADPHWRQAGNTANAWEFGAPHATVIGDPPSAHTGANVLGNGVIGFGTYDPDETTQVVAPPVDVSHYDRVYLAYWRWLTVQDARYDQATIAVNGQTAWQNATDETGTLDHVDKEWRQQILDLTPYAAQGTVQLAWTLATNVFDERGGWTLDDVCVVGQAKRATCGDGVLDDGEQCDDGNLAAGDGCSPTCRIEPTAGGGGGCDAGGGGGALALLLSGAAAARARCRRDRSRRARRSRRPGRAGRDRSSA
jgi:cysteine-rich repeat protein